MQQSVPLSSCGAPCFFVRKIFCTLGIPWREILLCGEKYMTERNGAKIALRQANRVSAISLSVNVVLAVLKLIAGILGHSAAMISDAVHTASDVGSTVVVMIGVNLSGRKADQSHPYGHERFECMAALILAALLFATAYGVGAAGVGKIADIGRGDGNIPPPTLLALGAAILSIAVKEWMYRYTRAVARRIRSGALMADAWHHRSDMLSSLGSLAGIVGAMLGVAVLDAVASLVICLMIAKAAADVCRLAASQLVDRGADEETLSRIKRTIARVHGVLDLDDVKTRVYGNRLYVDVEISVDGSLTLRSAHRIAEEVHAEIESDFPDVKHCMVHVNPFGRSAIL